MHQRHTYRRGSGPAMLPVLCSGAGGGGGDEESKLNSLFHDVNSSSFANISSGLILHASSGFVPRSLSLHAGARGRVVGWLVGGNAGGEKLRSCHNDV